MRTEFAREVASDDVIVGDKPAAVISARRLRNFSMTGSHWSCAETEGPSQKPRKWVAGRHGTVAHRGA